MSSASVRLVLVALVALAACRQEEPAPPVVARVADEPILAEALARELARTRAESAAAGAPDEGALDEAPSAGAASEADRDTLKRTVLESMIERRLLLQEARRLGLGVVEHEVEAALARRHEALGGVEDAAFSPEDDAALRERTRDQILIERLLLREVAARVALGPDEARAWYDAHQDQFRSDEEVRASHVLVATREEAEAVRREAVRGQDFARLASERSQSPDSLTGGDLGFFVRGAMPEAFDVCFSLRKGEVSDVVESAYGFHVFKVTDRRDGRVIPFADVEEQLELKLRRDAVEDAQVAYARRLREKAGVVVFDDVLAQVP